MLGRTVSEITKIIIIAGIPIVLGLVLCLIVILRGRMGLKPYETKTPPGEDDNIESTKEISLWAEQNDFHLIGYYTVSYGMRCFLAVWQSKHKPTDLCMYIVRTPDETVIACAFETLFENGFDLTTADTKDAILCPTPPKLYRQSFWGCGLKELYRIHLKSERYLIEAGGAQLKRAPVDFEKEFVRSMKEQNRWQWKHWYWIFFLLYFYFVRRGKWHNKTIQQQHELRMIRLPNEIDV